MGPRLKVSLIVAALAVPVAASAYIYVHGGSSDGPAQSVPKISDSKNSAAPIGLQPAQQAPAIRDAEFTLKPVTDFSYTRRNDGDYHQVLIKHKGDAEAIGELIVDGTDTGGLGELVATQSGGYNPDAVHPPNAHPLIIGGVKGAVLVTDPGTGTIRVTGIVWRNHKSVLLTFSGAAGEEASLETMVKEHAAAISFN
jgi:hypothetical protein